MSAVFRNITRAARNVSSTASAAKHSCHSKIRTARAAISKLWEAPKPLVTPSQQQAFINLQYQIHRASQEFKVNFSHNWNSSYEAVRPIVVLMEAFILNHGVDKLGSEEIKDAFADFSRKSLRGSTTDRANSIHALSRLYAEKFPENFNAVLTLAG